MDTGQVRLDTAVVLALAWSGGYLLSTHCLLQVSPCCQLVVVELRAAKGLVVAAWCWDKEAQVCRYRHNNLDILTWVSSPGYPHLVLYLLCRGVVAAPWSWRGSCR